MSLEEEIHQKSFRNLRHKTGTNLIYTYNWFINVQAQLFKEQDLTIQQYNILRILRGQHPKPATVKLLKERMLDKMSDASRLVDKLEAKGLAKRTLNRADRRSVDIHITPQGLEILERLDERANAFDDCFAHLSDQELELFNQLLDKLRTRKKGKDGKTHPVLEGHQLSPGQ